MVLFRKEKQLIKKLIYRTFLIINIRTMIIPIKCFTCGNVLANKWDYYVREVRKEKIAKNIDLEKVVYLTGNNIEKTIEGKILDNMKLYKMCCRRHMLTHVDIE
jgi:DNA-directed RNA polymerase subunit N (RpoN/RPB10)|tara:strand:+ start:781 stop:1092 length:312 start_codon:yes stop_codon:yes gene_type:complete